MTCLSVVHVDCIRNHGYSHYNRTMRSPTEVQLAPVGTHAASSHRILCRYILTPGRKVQEDDQGGQQTDLAVKTTAMTISTLCGYGNEEIHGGGSFDLQVQYGVDASGSDHDLESL